MAAIDSGADALYIGAASHGARAAAANSLDDLERLCEAAHRFNVKVYATVNTIVYDSELEDVDRMVWQLWRIGVDALIVQDMALLEMHLPPIELHASTQCDIRTPEKARFLAAAGFARLVLPREFSLEETAAVRAALSKDVEIEAFVHGALCVSYSGDCHAGFAAMGRSANRGECPQICRLPFDLVDSSGRKYVEGKHLLSLRDLNRSNDIEAMIRAGVDSFKIEGRLKDANYVKNVVGYYRQRIDRVLDRDPELGVRSSAGMSTFGFRPDAAESFNRGFTGYFTHGTPERTTKMASIDSPKWCGRAVARVKRSTPNCVEVEPLGDFEGFANGDGLGFFDKNGVFAGFRLNRADGNRLFPAQKLPTVVAPSTIIYRNRNKEFDDNLNLPDSALRKITIDMTLRLVGESSLALDIVDSDRGNRVTATIEASAAFGQAQKPQEDARANALRKTGGTIYATREIVDLAGDRFVQLSLLSELRRRGIELLDRAQRMRYNFRRRRREESDLELPQSMRKLDYHANVANKLSERFYRRLGAEAVARAMETEHGDKTSVKRVMTTRYCLRRELGECLKDPNRKRRLPDGDLWLCHGDLKMKIKFDCRRCGMELYL